MLLLLSANILMKKHIKQTEISLKISVEKVITLLMRLEISIDVEVVV